MTIRIQTIVSFLLMAILLCAGSATNLRAGRSDSLLCQVRVVEYLDEAGLNATSQVEEDPHFKCILPNHTMSYQLDLPKNFVDKHPHVGTGHVSITNAHPVWDPESMMPPFIALSQDSSFSIASPHGDNHEGRRLDESRHSRTHGNKTILVLRVTSPDGIVELSKEQLSERIFGIGENVLRYTVKSQYSACSYGKLNLIPAEGTGVVNGVLEVNITSNVVNVNPEYLEPIIAQQAETALGVPSLDDAFDFIIFVLPWGTRRNGCCQKWFGFADIGGRRSFYNNENAGYMTIVMHELGHNWGLSHSAEGTYPYGDRSGLMGASYQLPDWPIKCFNGHKNYLLGWFSDATTTVDMTNLPWTGNICALTTYDVIRPRDFMIVNIGDLYLQYNRAKNFNVVTGDDPNQITIVQGTSPDAYSYLLGAVSRVLPTLPERYPTIHRIDDFQGTGTALIIEACEQNYLSRDSPDLPDVIRVSLHLEDGNQTSACNSPLPPPPPTPSPTPMPSASPSEAPSASPSIAPSVELDCTGMDQPGLVPISHHLGNQTCQWIADNKAWKLFLCREGYEAFEQCQETCDSCNAHAVSAQADSCEDSRKMMYFNEALGNRRCFWFGMFLERSPHWRDRLCAPGQVAYDHCPETCGKCTDTCEDQADVYFFVNRQEGHRNCAWLAERPLWQAILCEENHDAFKYCNESCDSCS